ncbi:MAG: hypothetical protein AAF907_09710 [Planctomycetota bacterium]
MLHITTSSAESPSPREPHRIRLRGPWEWRPEAGDPQPARLPFSAPAGGVLRRFFNTPTGLDDGTAVRFRVEAKPNEPAATLDDRPVSGSLDGRSEADLTALLGEAGVRHRLDLRVAPGTVVESVTLELRPPEPPTADQRERNQAAAS